MEHEKHMMSPKEMKKMMGTKVMKAMHKKEMMMDDNHPSKGMGKMGGK